MANRRNHRKDRNHKVKPRRKSGQSIAHKEKKLHVKRELFERHKDDIAPDYSLHDIHEIAYPVIRTSIDVQVSGSPGKVLQEIHLILLEAIQLGLNTKAELAHFMGITEDDFILDELYALQKEGLLEAMEEDKYRITTKGELFIEQRRFIPVTTQEEFTFYVDGFTSQIKTEVQSTKCENKLKPDVKVNYEFVQEHWLELHKQFSLSKNNEKEIVDLTDYKRSVGKPKVTYYLVYALVYYPKSQSGKKAQVKVYDGDQQYLKEESKTISKLFEGNKYLFDFSEELRLTEENKTQLEEAAKENKQEKFLTGNYKDISTFEHKDLIREALLTAQFAVYIESPWIRRATMNYLEEMKHFLNRKGTRLFIAYGIDNTPRNEPHRETFEALRKLQQQYRDRFLLFHLPSHFQETLPDRNGSHRKLLIKDHDFYIKGSFNWLSYSGRESHSYAVEESTQFFDNVQQFWQKVFSDYQLDESLIDF